MQLLERLQYHIQKLTEEKWDYTISRNGRVEYVEDPIMNNSFKNFVKDDCEKVARGIFVKGKWYFWPAKHSIHDDFAKAIGVYNQWDPYNKIEISYSNSGLEIYPLFIGDIASRVYDDVKNLGKVSDKVKNEVKKAISMILDLNKRYNIRVNHKEIYKLKEMIQGKYPSLNKYDSIYNSNDYYTDSDKIARKQNKYQDKSLPRKNRQSRIGWNWPNNPDRLDLDIDLF